MRVTFKSEKESEVVFKWLDVAIAQARADIQDTDNPVTKRRLLSEYRILRRAQDAAEFAPIEG